jgi:hypothetical protein
LGAFDKVARDMNRAALVLERPAPTPEKVHVLHVLIEREDKKRQQVLQSLT